jgi:hypothetical protein
VAAIAAGTLILAAAQAAGAVHTAPPCAPRQLRLEAPVMQGTATQAVASVTIVNRGEACLLVASTTLTIRRDGARVASIISNPVRLRIDGTLYHGTTLLYNAWWSNWCGARSGLRALATVGALAASARYRVLPVCNTRRSPSRLQGIPEPPTPIVGGPVRAHDRLRGGLVTPCAVWRRRIFAGASSSEARVAGLRHGSCVLA